MRLKIERRNKIKKRKTKEKTTISNRRKTFRVVRDKAIYTTQDIALKLCTSSRKDDFDEK